MLHQSRGDDGSLSFHRTFECFGVSPHMDNKGVVSQGFPGALSGSSLSSLSSCNLLHHTATKHRSKHFALRHVHSLLNLELMGGQPRIASREWAASFMSSLGLSPADLRARPFEALDLFAGMCSVSTVLRDLGFQTHAVDIIHRPGITLLVDVSQWDFESWLMHHLRSGGGLISLLWSSPPCNNFSSMRVLPGRSSPSDKDLLYSIGLVRDSLTIFYKLNSLMLEVFGSEVSFIMENPAPGLLSTLAMVRPFFHNVTSYCWYQTSHSPEKPTVFVNNLKGLVLKPRCRRGKLGCGKVQHISSLDMTSEQLYHIPSKLLYNIFSSVPHTWTALANPLYSLVNAVTTDPDTEAFHEVQPVLDGYASLWLRQTMDIKLPSVRDPSFGPTSIFDDVVSATIRPQWFLARASKEEREVYDLIWSPRAFRDLLKEACDSRPIRDSSLSPLQIEWLLRHQIIRLKSRQETILAWGEVFGVPKKSGLYRVIFNPHVNQMLSLKVSMQLPSPGQIVHLAMNHQYLILVDFKSFFFQTKMGPGAQAFFGFRNGPQRFVFTVMGQGFCGSPPIAQLQSTAILKELWTRLDCGPVDKMPSHMLAWIDNLIIGAHSEAEAQYILGLLKTICAGQSGL